MLKFLYIIFFPWTSDGLQSIFYDTDQFGFDCLHYFSTESEFSEIVKYCIRPKNDTDSIMIEFSNISDDYMTFDELYRLNVTSHEILMWSSSIDLAERYQYYLDRATQSNLSNEKFFNCTQPWFGSRCQYSFEFNEDKLVKNYFETALTDDIFDGTCYILLECDRGGSSMCLDWREICDGRIDCLNGDVDEIQCFNLEINECNENEYRCHNGLCIPKIFLEMDFHEAQCLDRSDYLVKTSLCLKFYFRLNLFECQEFICRPDEGKFSCGDGQCVEDYGQCDNNRHLSLAQLISVRGNLSYNCWISIVCLTKIIDKIENILCDEFIQSSEIIEQLKSCKFPLQFPVIPVLYGHVTFLYHLKEIDNINVTLSLKPDYICYDEQLCDFLTPTYRHETLTCRSGDQMNLTINAELTTWKSLIDSIKPYFDGCITQHYHIIDSYNSTLYHCMNSSKYISKYRILDGISDCFLKDDEQALSELSCILNQTSQFQCPNEKQCRSRFFPTSICSFPIHISHDDIPFYKICDRIMDLPMMVIDGRNHSDETDCEHWPCNNINIRCDGFRNCVDGEDEERCTQPIDIKHILFCISPHNYTMKCSPVDQVSGGAVDCFGAPFVQFKYLIVPNITFQTYKFRCWNDNKCIGDENLCNANDDCPMYANELHCSNRSQLCHDSDFDKLINMQDIFCQVINKPFPSFSLETALDYPPLYTIQNKSIKNQIHNKLITSSSVKDSTQSEICNSGLYVYHRLGIDNYSSICFCPPNYYGDRCQYQNQRVSLTLTLTTVRQPIIYAIVVMLIEDDNDRQGIHSYHQFTYVPLEHCGQPVNLYLLYSKRGKNN
ncbi:unnamed protein product [Adineta steineri]|uniref:Uncharacterized protein n=1 Tax=Adineta steineri TaxID=433720 RepID=A0A814W5R4_9BILA|nr:unnamed protein product [Adineta steineri]CAF4047101.1 unnamed protein product [Adineta steineri]